MVGELVPLEEIEPYRQTGAALLFFIILFLIGLINGYIFKFKKGIKCWIGMIILSLGISGFIRIFFTEFNSQGIVAGFLVIIIGALVYFIKAKKEEEEWSCDYCNRKFKTKKECLKHEVNCPKKIK